MTTAKAIISAKFAPTNRNVTCCENYGIISAWSKLKTVDELIKHPTYRKIINEFDQLRHLKGSNIDLYRGRPKSQVCNPCPLNMGPPLPSPDLPEGRYNVAGESVLYLADSEYGVKRELANKASKILIQKFTIPLSILKIADLTVYEPRSIINAVMWHCELSNNDGYPSFIFSQTIARILKEKGLDGAKVFGVRGDFNKTYNNIFIFDPNPRWVSWVNSKMKPHILRVTNKDSII